MTVIAVTIGVEAGHMRRQKSAIEDKKMRAAIYCKTIGGKGKSAKAQENILRRLCQQRGWTVHKVYSDQPNRTQKHTSKTARISMITDMLCVKSACDVICVWHLKMLGHAIDDLLWTLDELHVSRHIQIVAPGDQIDTTVGDGMASKVIKALAKV